MYSPTKKKMIKTAYANLLEAHKVKTSTASVVESSLFYMSTPFRTANTLFKTGPTLRSPENLLWILGISTLENISSCLLLIIPTIKKTLQQMNSSFNDQVLKWLTDYTWFIINFTFNSQLHKTFLYDRHSRYEHFLTLLFYSKF